MCIESGLETHYLACVIAATNKQKKREGASDHRAGLPFSLCLPFSRYSPPAPGSDPQAKSQNNGDLWLLPFSWLPRAHICGQALHLNACRTGE